MYKIEEELIKFNQSIFKENDDYSDHLLIDGTLDVPESIVGMALSGKIFNEVKKLTPIVILRVEGQRKEAVMQVYRSYGINHFITYPSKYIAFISGIFSLFSILSFYIKSRGKSDILKYHFRGIQAGDLLYDQYLRNGNDHKGVNIYTLKFFKYMIYQHGVMNFFKGIFKKFNIKHSILTHITYVDCGYLRRVSLIEYQAPVSLLTATLFRTQYTVEDLYNHPYCPTKEEIDYLLGNPSYLPLINKWLEDRWSGNMDQHDVKNAFSNKTIYTHKELIKKLNIKNSKPIVFVMPHVFKDAPHHHKEGIFPDYFDWFIETLKICSEQNHVNWIFKEHPSSHMYGEKGLATNLIKQYSDRSDCIFQAPDDISTASVFSITKTVLTICGSIGLEAACMGVKPIICSRAIYSNFDIALRAKSKDHFKSIIQNIHLTDFTLTDKQIKVAKAIMYIWISARNSKSQLGFSGFAPGGNQEEKRINQYENVYKGAIDTNYRNDRFFIRLKELVETKDPIMFDYDI